jgi:hypothetical protein
MDDKDFPPLFVRLALRAVLCGAGLITIYTALDRIMLWLGLAPK